MEGPAERPIFISVYVNGSCTGVLYRDFGFLFVSSSLMEIATGGSEGGNTAGDVKRLRRVGLTRGDKIRITHDYSVWNGCRTNSKDEI